MRLALGQLFVEPPPRGIKNPAARRDRLLLILAIEFPSLRLQRTHYFRREPGRLQYVTAAPPINFWHHALPGNSYTSSSSVRTSGILM
jgi:hypothetical protein